MYSLRWLGDSVGATSLKYRMYALMSDYHFKRVSVCVWVTEVGSSGGGSTVVMHDLCTYHTLYCMWVITSERTWGATAEADTIGEKQAEVDAIGEQLLKQMQSGSSSWSGHNGGAVRCDHARLVLARDTTAQGCWCIRSRGLRQTHTDVVKEVRITTTYVPAVKRELSCAMLC